MTAGRCRNRYLQHNTVCAEPQQATTYLARRCWNVLQAGEDLLEVIVRALKATALGGHSSDGSQAPASAKPWARLCAASQGCTALMPH